jgi:hypothetical protein
MFPAKGAGSHSVGRGALQRLQLPDRNDASVVAAGDESGRGANHFYGPVSGTFEDVWPYRAGGIGNGLAVVDSKQMPPAAIGTTDTTLAVAKKNGSGRTLESSVKPPSAEDGLKKAAESEAQEEEKKR